MATLPPTALKRVKWRKKVKAWARDPDKIVDGNVPIRGKEYIAGSKLHLNGLYAQMHRNGVYREAEKAAIQGAQDGASPHHALWDSVFNMRQDGFALGYYKDARLHLTPYIKWLWGTYWRTRRSSHLPRHKW